MIAKSKPLLLLVSLCISPLLLGQSVLDIVKQRNSRDESIWKNERLAQDYESAFIQLWDEMRASEDAFESLAAFPFDTIEIPAFEKARDLPHDITTYLPDNGTASPLKRAAFNHLLRSYQSKGYRIEQSEWHHAAFQASDGKPAQSEFTFALHVLGPEPEKQRSILRGRLAVNWRDTPQDGTYWPQNIRILDLDILTRETAPAFSHKQWLESKPNSTPYGIVLVEDINRDGLPDIAFPRRNALYLNKGNFQFEETLLAKFMIRGMPTAAIFADLNLDGNLEYVVSTFEAPFLFAYSYNPTTQAFDGKPFGIWKSDTQLQVGLLAAGDLTGDGYPEIYLGQSSPAYEDGKIPTPYFDANDGRPAFLLRNVNGLRFEDMTELSSIAQKRGRRAFTASFQDLNHDQSMDLLVTSDFSGIDIHENRYGALKIQTEKYVDDRSLFGMSHSFADFDRDGEIDLLAVGMSSTTARRLEQMGLGRDEFPEHQKMRMRIAKGNRLYYGDSKSRLAERSTSEDVARSGWSWGSSTLDFNNDSYPDIFIANGYLSKSTARDYCTHFWTHDIYTESAFSTKQLDAFYTQFGPEALVGGNEMGWNPFEKDHLYLNLNGKEFINISYLMGVSHGGDGRAVIGQDFDRDGRTDLLLVELDSLKSLNRVHLYRNQIENAGNWVGVDLLQTPKHPLIGARVIIEMPHYTTERLYTLGETFSGQHASTLNFGLGDNESILRIRVLWPDGAVTEIENPAINKYHQISPNP